MDDIVKLAYDQYEESENITQHWRMQAKDDLAFAAGDQWDPMVSRWRTQDRRPMLTVDRIEPAIALIVGNQRRNDIAIKVVQRGLADGKFRSIDGATECSQSDLYNGLVREIQQRSHFDSVMSTAFEHMVQCGVGAWTVETEYEEGLTFDQRIKIGRVLNPLSIYPDVSSRWAGPPQYGHIVEMLSEDEYRNKYGEEAMGGFSGDVRSTTLRTGVMISQWYNIEKEMVRIEMIRTEEGKIIVLEAKDAKILKDTGMRIELLRKREMAKNKVFRRIINGSEVLEESIWPGQYLPMITLFGPESVTDGQLDWRGIVRKAKDPQRLYNYARSTVAEMMGAAPKAPYMVTDEMVRDYEDEWAQASVGNKPYIRFRPDPRMSGAMPARQQMSYPQGFAEEARVAADDIKAVTKVWDASLGARSNETSGRAILARQSESDMGNYWFTDALMLGVEQTGIVLVDALPGVLDGTRTVMPRGKDGTQTAYVINDGEQNRLTKIECGVEVIAGPAFATARQEAVTNMAEMGRVAPKMMEIAADIWMRNQDWPGADEIADRLKKAVPPQFLDDSDPLKQVAMLKQELQMAKTLVAKFMQERGEPLPDGFQNAGMQQQAPNVPA